MDNKQKLFNKLADIATELKKVISKKKVIQVFSHLDADGISAAGIISKALIRENTPFQIRILKQLNIENIKNINNFTNSEVFIFCDMGSGQVDNLIKLLNKRSNIFIFDHHELGEDYDEIHHLNPHFYGFNGSIDISGAGVTYLVAKALNPKNIDLSPLALIGAIGDLQDKGDQRSFMGLNKEVILKDALENNLIEEKKDILLFGSETRPIHLSLKYTTDPFIPDLSGNEENCISFLKETGILLMKDGKWRSLSDLTKDEKVKLYSALVTFMLQRGVNSKKAQE
ncbi:MAG: DHH family phosphoesterase, partial [Candidatus Odinarchaeia archaeon]